MPCPKCVDGRTARYIGDRAEILQQFGRRLRDLNELACPTCRAGWIVERASGDGLHIYLSTGTVPAITGGWAFSESAPQGEGSRHGSMLTLTRDGDELAGEFAHWGFNEHAEEETRGGDRCPVRGEWIGDYAWLTLLGGKVELEGGATALFFVKPYGRVDANGLPEERLLVSRYEELIRQHRAFRTWRRSGSGDSPPTWVTSKVPLKQR